MQYQMEEQLYLICVYVPDTDTEKVKQAMFNAGAGDFGQYDQCCWQTQGTGQFRPLAHSNPSIGIHQQLTMVSETKIEIICQQSRLKPSIDALKSSHPYEVPAYQIIPFSIL
jgi:hypothetical protein